MRGKKIGIIIIVILLIIAIFAGIITYLFLNTDVFLGKNQAFSKYLIQGISQVEDVMKSESIKKYISMLNDETCETNTKLDFKYSEGGEISSGYNNLSMNMKTQKDQQYNYKNLQILFGDISVIQVESIKQDDLDGIRFTNIFKQFLTFKDGKNIEDSDLTNEEVETMKKVIEDDKEFYSGILFSKEDYENIKNKYLQIFADAMKQGEFSKQNNSVITIDSKTEKTTAYSCKLSSIQVQNLIIKILNNLQNDDIIVEKVQNLLGDSKKYKEYVEEILRDAEDTEYPEVNITTYVQDRKNIRTSITMNTDTVNIETSNNEGKYVLKIQHEQINSEKENSQKIEISRETTSENEKYILNVETIDGKDEYSAEAVLTSDYKTTEFNLDFYKGIININVKAQNTITNIVKDKINLGSDNNVLANDLDKTVLKMVVQRMKNAYTDTLVKRYNLLVKKLQSEDLMTALKSILTDSESNAENTDNANDNETDNQATKEEINRFNAKFEFYTGSEISAESVKTLLDVVKDHLESVDITPLNTASTSTSEKIKERIKLNIKKDNPNVDLATGIKEKLEENEKYDIAITYNDKTGIIETLTIEPNKK